MNDTVMWEWRKAQACGCSHGIPLEYLRRFNHLSLDIPTLHQQPSGRFVETTFLSLYILCAILGASLCFAFIFVLFVFWSYSCWILALFVWERDTLHFFVWILICFAYIFLSILSYCLFASKLSLLVFILFRSGSCWC